MSIIYNYKGPLGCSDFEPSKKNKGKKKLKRAKKKHHRPIKSGSTRFFWCIGCEAKTRFVRRKVKGESGFFFDTIIRFNDGSTREISDNQYFSGDECVVCKRFVRR